MATVDLFRSICRYVHNNHRSKVFKVLLLFQYSYHTCPLVSGFLFHVLFRNSRFGLLDWGFLVLASWFTFSGLYFVGSCFLVCACFGLLVRTSWFGFLVRTSWFALLGSHFMVRTSWFGLLLQVVASGLIKVSWFGFLGSDCWKKLLIS